MCGEVTGLASIKACSRLLSCMLSQHVHVSLVVHLKVYREAPQSGGRLKVQRALFMSTTHSGDGGSRCYDVSVFPTGACPSVCARSRRAIVLLLGRRGENRPRPPPQPPQWPYGNRAGPLSARQWRYHGGRARDHVQTGEHPGDTVG